MANEKVISSSRLLSLIRGGAEVKTDDQPTTIRQFDELVEKIEALLQATNVRAEADLARSKTMMEVIAYLQIQFKANVIRSKPTDLTPLKTVLTKIQANTERRPLPGYEFTVTERDRLGDIKKLKVEPISPTQYST